MKRPAVFMLCAAFPALLSAGPAAAQPLLQRCERPMADAASAVDQVAACAAFLAKAKPSQQPPPPVAQHIPADIKRQAMTEPVFSNLVERYAYSAFLAKNFDLCDPLELLDYSEHDCIRIAERALATKEAFGSNEEVAANCIKRAQKPHESDANDKLSPTHDRYKDPNRPGRSALVKTVGPELVKTCRFVAENRFRPVDCSKLVPVLAPDEAGCKAFFAMFNGDEGACRNLKAERKPGGSERDACLDQVAYVKAFKAKNPALCGASRYCRALMGEGADVVSKLDAALTDPAGAWFLKGEWKSGIPRYAVTLPAPAARPAAPAYAGALPPGFVCAEPFFSPTNQKAATNPILAAHTCLSDIELALPRVDLETANGIDDREEKLARLGVRLDSYFRLTGAAKAPAPAARPARPAKPAR